MGNCLFADAEMWGKYLARIQAEKGQRLFFRDGDQVRREYTFEFKKALCANNR